MPNTLARDQCVFVQDGVIQEIASHLDAPADAQIVDASDKIVLPGFIDIHVHGAMGADTMDATPEALRTMAQFYAQHGVTGFLPTTMTAAREEIDAAVANAARWHTEPGLASVLGVHIEGPYVNPRQAGAQPPQFMRPANAEEYGKWFDAGVVRLMTIAPEMGEPNLKLIEYAIKKIAPLPWATPMRPMSKPSVPLRWGQTKLPIRLTPCAPCASANPGWWGPC
ncbi:MAG: amidohydrolase family protein [Anaerolineae bacterium]|nr:amidohydrolase family protein [Anaerolineae bacterium]